MFCSEWVEVSANCYNTARFTATSWLLLVQVDTPEWLCLSRCHSCRAGEEGEDTSKPSSRRLNPIIIRNIHTRRQRRRHILTPKMCCLTGQSVMELSELSGKRLSFLLNIACLALASIVVSVCTICPNVKASTFMCLV